MRVTKALDKIYNGHNNPVVFTFQFEGDFATDGLNNFTKISVQIDDQEINTTDHPDELMIESTAVLKLVPKNRTFATEGEFMPVIIGFNDMYPDGYVLNDDEYSKLPNGVFVTS